MISIGIGTATSSQAYAAKILDGTLGSVTPPVIGEPVSFDFVDNGDGTFSVTSYPSIEMPAFVDNGDGTFTRTA